MTEKGSSPDSADTLSRSCLIGDEMKLYEKIDIEKSTGRNRVFNFYTCDCCGTEYKKQKRLAEGAKMEHFCSPKCYNNALIRVKVSCAHCGVAFLKTPSRIDTKSGLHFCSREHKDLAQSYIKEIQPDHYGTGLTRYRTKALEFYGKECSICGYDNEHALEVHHIDEDRSNNDITNLKVLCANCHTLTHKGKL
jgi:hypothetical protein